jgi:hypothetical protein
MIKKFIDWSMHTPMGEFYFGYDSNLLKNKDKLNIFGKVILIPVTCIVALLYNTLVNFFFVMPLFFAVAVQMLGEKIFFKKNEIQ